MSQGNVCRLCAEICQDYKSLYDESGNASEVQQLMIQYFDENLLHMITGTNPTLLCMKCWHTISDFNSFQQSVYRTQRVLCMKDEEIDIKSEEEFLPEDHIGSSNCEQPTGLNILAGEEATLPRCDKGTVYVPSADDTSNTDDNVEYDDPVGVFSGGEFGNESNSSELLIGTEMIAECNEASKIKDRLTKSIPQKVSLGKKLGISLKASDDLIAQWTSILKCVYCTDTCSTYSLLQLHFQNKHPLLKCQVNCCSRNYSRRYKFEDHIRLHIDSNAFACTFCGSKKTCRTSLAYHIRKDHPDPIETPINPSYDSNTVTSLSAKVTKISTKSIPQNIGELKSSRSKYFKWFDDFIARSIPHFKCDLCPEKYTTFSIFRQHFSESHPEEKFYITCCKRKFTRRGYILEHLQLHANPDVFMCKLCKARYTRRARLILHMRKYHTTSIKENEKTRKIKNGEFDDLLAKWLPSTKCVVCNEAFATLAELEHHFLECHPNEEFYVECCQRKLMTRCKIEAHVRYHVKPTDFKCDLCCICYSHQRTLKRHMRMVH